MSVFRKWPSKQDGLVPRGNALPAVVGGLCGPAAVSASFNYLSDVAGKLDWAMLYR